MNIEIKLNDEEIQVYKRIICDNGNLSTEKLIQHIYDLGLLELFGQVMFLY